MRLILTGPHAGRSCEDWFAEICDADTIDTVKAARIIREHNEAAAKAEQAVPVATTAEPEPTHVPIVDAEHPPEGYRLAKVGEKREPGYMWWSLCCESWTYGDDDGITIRQGDNPIANPIPKPLPGAQGLAEKVQEIHKANHAASIVDDSAQVIARQNRDLTEAARRIVEMEARLAKAEDKCNAWRAGHQERTHEADILRAEVARLKRQRLILTAWMRMFRASLFQWMTYRPTLRMEVHEIMRAWRTHPRHGAAWIASKEGAKL